VALLSIELDGFKKINDSFGHAAGDAVLIETARRLRSCIRDTDTVARMGGDEFAVLLTEADGASANTVRARIAAALVGPVPYEGHELTCEASIGAAALGPDGTDADTLVNAADARMYEVKASRALARAG
jgi:diguanylate cyclase (GGDEF)-like protein